MDKKYVLHYGNITGMPYQYARSLDRIGISSISVVSVDRDFGSMKRNLPFDGAISRESEGRFVRLLKKGRFFFGQVIPNCALVHYYSDSMLWNCLDYKILHSLARPMVISFGGTDVRIESMARKNNPYVYIPPYSKGEEKIRKRLEHISRYVRYAATDCELAEYVRPYFEKVFILPQPIDLSDFDRRLPKKDAKTPVVMHLPTNREIKGTEYVEAAVERLESEGLAFDFVLLNPDLSQRQVKDEIASADIVVNEIRTGAYGVFAVEAMASGKPNISYIREDLKEKYPADLPIVSANPDTIYEKLRELITDADLRFEIGKKGRAYAEKYHSLEVIGPKLKAVYQEIGLRTLPDKLQEPAISRPHGHLNP